MRNLQSTHRFDVSCGRSAASAWRLILLIAFVVAATYPTFAQQAQSGVNSVQNASAAAAPKANPSASPAPAIEPRAANQSNTPSAIPPPNNETSTGSWLWMLFGGLFVSAVGLSTTLFARVRKRRADEIAYFEPEPWKFEPSAKIAARNVNYINGDGAEILGGDANTSEHIVNSHNATFLSSATASGAAGESDAMPEHNSENIDEGAPHAATHGDDDGVSRSHKYDSTEETTRQHLTLAHESQNLSSRHTMPSSDSFGAFRIEQEVARLVEGEPYRLDVLTSRTLEDRRAIEAALMKWFSDQNASEDVRRRARVALEEYGFVARRSAVLLCAPDAFERAAAARMLGEIKSTLALPFLLEALHDAENAVRVEAVVTIGALGLPSSIGALLDAARRHPEIPASVLQKSLNACSVETEMYNELPSAQPASQLASGDEMFNPTPIANDKSSGHASLKISSLMPTRMFPSLRPTAPVESLPEWMENESLYEALENFQHSDIETRVTAAVMMAQFPVQSAIDALTAMVAHDPEPRARAAAVTSLGAINHESVFKPVLLALADESREVRAAGARALSRLTFDRAEAYVRVLETFDDASLREVAHACAKVGLAAQALERITSPDARQAYEACAVLTLMARAGYVMPLIQTIENHADINVRLAVVKLLGTMGNADVVEGLRRVVSRGDVPEQIRMAIMEIIHTGDETQAEKAN